MGCSGRKHPRFLCQCNRADSSPFWNVAAQEAPHKQFADKTRQKSKGRLGTGATGLWVGAVRQQGHPWWAEWACLCCAALSLSFLTLLLSRDVSISQVKKFTTSFVWNQAE